MKAAVTLLLLCSGLICWTWGTWPDPLIDFGRELYAAWRISDGDRLHRDLAWFNGPLSAWWNGLLFWVFGSGLRVLVVSNLMILALVCALLWRLLRQWSDGFTATAGCAIFVSLFAFHQYAGIGNYNFITPYSHELTHGFALALGLLAALSSFDKRSSLPKAAGIGGLLALIALTKVEVAVAAACATVFSLALGWLCRDAESRSQGRGWLGVGAAMGAAALIVLGGASFYLSTALGWRGALDAIAVPYRSAFNEDLRRLLFYEVLSGMDDPGANALAMLRNAGWMLALLCVPWVAARCLPARVLAQAWLRVVIAVLLGLGLWAALREPALDWVAIARGLPVIALFAWLGSTHRAWRATESSERSAALSRASFALFATLLLLKTLLNARLVHYGFVLAVPASLLLIATACHSLPERLRRTRGGDAARMARVLALGLFLAVVALHWEKASGWYEWKKYELGVGADRFAVATRGHYAAQMLEEIERRLEPDEAFLVLPEGVMLNYLARRPAPSEYLNYMPPEVLLFGEESMLEALQKNPPRFIVLAHKDTSEYGFPIFGHDYALSIGQWLLANYRPVHKVGKMPLSGQGFGIALLERQD
ncbi:MAG: hypothetical protein ACI841_000511 [Planctomycetota bacterium]